MRDQSVSIERSSARISLDLSGLPQFFAVGPPRTATTWLHSVLRGHVNLPRIVKEPRFFDLRYSKGLDWYRGHFRPLEPGLPIGEISPTYFYSIKARERIAKLLPRTGIICTLRDPVERLYSLYKIRCATRTIRAPFAEAIRRDRELVESSRYLFHLSGWLDLFGREQVLLLVHEQLIRAPQAHLDAICRFIGIAPFTLDEARLSRENSSDIYPAPALGRLTHVAVRVGTALKTNSFHRTLSVVRRFGLNKVFFKDEPYAAPPLDPRFAQELRERMRPEVEALEALLNIDLSMWKPKPA